MWDEAIAAALTALKVLLLLAVQPLYWMAAEAKLDSFTDS